MPEVKRFSKTHTGFTLPITISKAQQLIAYRHQFFIDLFSTEHCERTVDMDQDFLRGM